jgi:hypothetical protein
MSLDLMGQRVRSYEWKGYHARESTWLHSTELGDATQKVDQFWAASGCSRNCVITVSAGNRCVDCCGMFNGPQDLKKHTTAGCPRAGGSRVGTRAETALLKK